MFHQFWPNAPLNFIQFWDKCTERPQSDIDHYKDKDISDMFH